MNGEEINQGSNSKIIWTGIVILILFSLVIFYAYKNPYNKVLKDLRVQESPPSSIRLLFVGDMMLDRNVRNIIDKKGFDFFFSGVKNLVQSADVAVANLEGSFTSFPSITSSLKSKELQFTFDPALVSAVSDLGFDILGLANNHSLNFGKAGLEMSRRYIGGAGMAYYGDPNNKDEISTVITQNGVRVGLVGFHEFTYLNFNKVFSEIQKLRSLVDVLIVSPHWGNEYDRKPTEYQRKWARQFIDLGADAVIGAHSHVVGEIEDYKGKKIYYSLGNFAFDQYFSTATMEGLAVLVKVEKENGKIDLEYTEIPIQVDREGTRVVAGR